jgi:hypothetical protein
VKSWMQRQAKKKGKKKALSILEAKIGRCVYHLWKKQVPFDVTRFLNSWAESRPLATREHMNGP